MPAARAQASTAGSEWISEWTQGDVAMAAWVAANGTKGAAYLWFEKASLLGEATLAWHSKWTADVLELTVGNAAMVETLVKETGGSGDDGLCDVGSQSAGAWSTSNTNAQAATTIAECKTACETAAFAALVVNPNTTSGSAGATSTADNGGATMGAYATDVSAAWCGGYSWDDDNGTANLKCQLLLGSDVPVAPTASSTSDRCSKLTTVKAFADLAANLFTAWGNVTATLLTNLTSATDVQAGLEKTWLQAWYEQQYWAALNTMLTTVNSSTSATSDNTNVALA